MVFVQDFWSYYSILLESTDDQRSITVTYMNATITTLMHWVSSELRSEALVRKSVATYITYQTEVIVTYITPSLIYHNSMTHHYQ